MYLIKLVDSYGYEFESIMGEFETVEDALRSIEWCALDDLEKLDDMNYLDGHDLYTIYRRNDND